MEIDVLDHNGAKKESLDVSSEIFDAPFNEALVHQVIVACRANARAGTKAQKNRSEVNGGGRKPWRQKGTGRARAGTRSSPINRGGGATFAAVPKDFSKKVNRKSYRIAMRSLLSEIRRRGNLVVVNDIELEQPKTRELAARLAAYDCDSALIVDADVTDNLDLASRNLPNVNVIVPSMMNPALMADSRMILMTRNAIETVDGWLK